MARFFHAATDVEMIRPFMEHLSSGTIAEIERRSIARAWPPHSSIFRVGDACEGLHFVVDGLVKLFRSNPSGQEQIVLLEGAGSVLTLAPAIDALGHLASAQTIKATSTLFLPRRDFIDLQATHADFRETVLAEMARRFRLTVALMETIALKPVAARVATRIIDIASANDALDGSKRFALVLRQEELARVLATSRESVARALAELRTNGVIEQRGSRIRILDPPLLSAWAHHGGVTLARPQADSEGSV
jgi:CRP/FNR family transcriptional regulator, dissimilatory nitrate respiration regulator